MLDIMDRKKDSLGRTLRGYGAALAVVGAAALSSVAITPKKDENESLFYDVSAATRRKIDELLSSTPILKEQAILTLWERASGYAQEGNLVAAGTELEHMATLMSQRKVTPQSLGIETEYAALVRRAAEAHIAYAISLVTPDEQGISPYGQKLQRIRDSAKGSPPVPMHVLTQDYTLSDPRGSLLTAKALLTSIGNSLDLEALRPFVKGALRDDCAFASGMGPTTALVDRAITHMCTTSNEFCMGGMSEAFDDEEIRKELTAMMDQLRKTAENSLRQGNPNEDALQHVVTFFKIGRQVGFPEAVQRTIDSMEIDPSRTMEENFLVALQQVEAEEHP